MVRFHSSRNRLPGRGCRRGLASLELVLLTPLILLLAALIFKIGEGYMGKCQTNVAARRYSAIPRSAPVDEAPPLPRDPTVIAALQPQADQTGLVRQPAERSLSLSPIGTGKATIRARYAALFGSWDYRALVFADRDSTDPWDPRALRMAGLGYLDSLLPQFPVDPGSSGFSPDQLIQLGSSQLENAIPYLKDAKEALNILQKPKNALKDITNEVKGLKDLLSNPQKVKKAVEKLGQIRGAFDKASRLIQQMINMKDTLQDDV